MRPFPPRTIQSKPPDLATLVVEVLTFFAEEPERLDGFLMASGLTVGDLRSAAATPAFGESLLDHLCSDERLLVAFAAAREYEPASIERVRQTLTPPPFEG